MTLKPFSSHAHCVFQLFEAVTAFHEIKTALDAPCDSYEISI